MSVPVFDEQARANAAALIAMALQEDLDDVGDLTSNGLIDESQHATVAVVVRQPGVVAGLPVMEMVFDELGGHVEIDCFLEDGAAVEAGTTAAKISGPLRTLLTGERTVLNFLTSLSGVSTLTAQFVSAITGTQAKVLDTRKTWPGWRHLQKYAVRAGGGTNHRIGLFDGVLIKDNHLAGWQARGDHGSIADAIKTARAAAPPNIPIEVEVDTLEQFQDALDGGADMVLLDNMSCETLSRAVVMRDELAPEVQLEASGGVNLKTIANIAATGVERISVGALTHSAVALDIAFDWSNHD